jgi:hypothetical protein
MVDALSSLISCVHINSQGRRGRDALAFGGRKDFAPGILTIRDGLRAFSFSSTVAVKSDTDCEESSTLRSLLRAGNRFLAAQSLEKRPPGLPWQNHA